MSSTTPGVGGEGTGTSNISDDVDLLGSEVTGETEEDGYSPELRALIDKEKGSSQTEEGDEDSEEGLEETGEEEEDEEEEQVEDEGLGKDRPTFKEINAKFPTLFKDFPGLKHAFFKEREYSALFPTVEDAKVAANG